MGDDPYDFEIAIPSGGATRSGGGGDSAKNFGSRRYGSDSSDGSDGSDVSVSNSDESDHDDDHDDEEEDSPVKAITKPSKQHTQSTVVARSTASTGGGGGGSSALDKAKSFLSKYSTKSVDTKQSKPQASRRVELSLDDSMDFSSDEDEDDGSSARKQKETASSAKTAVKSTTKVASAPTKRVQLSDSEDYGIDSDDEKSHKAALQGIRGVEKEESESDDADSARGSRGYRSGQHQEAVVTPASIPSRFTTAVAATPRAAESSVGEDYDEEDEEVASFMDESDEGDPPPFTAAVPSRAPVSDAVKSGVSSSVLEASKPHSAAQYANLEKSEEHEESIASKSDYVESFEDEDDGPPSSKPVVAAAAKQVIAASESGVYEDEAFDEESGVVPASAQASNQPPISQLGGSSRAFDYSMDFSDDNVVEGKLETPPRAAAAAAHSVPVMQTEAVREQESAPPSPANSHESERQEQSDYLESDEDRSVIARDLEAPSGDEKLALSASHSSESAVIDVYKNSVAPVAIHSDTEVASRTDVVWSELDTVRDQKPQGLLAPSVVQQESLTQTVSRTIPSDQQSKAPVACGPPLHTVAPTTVTTRGRVLIVREYEQPARESVEMKDASTQFTGNHAGIQADLTPDGMHSLHSSSAPEAPTSPSLPEHRTSGAATDHGKSACDPSPAPAVPPSPPPAPMLGSPGYSMDLLRLPTAVTTSIYKQQLLALQEQILTKKRETERLVQERMTFQYSSLRGTERFLASNRPGKLELWQALMRVDPTLTEHKAREIARLTAENAAA